jgi:hypothetical protein
MINPESLRKYSRIISSCENHEDMDFVIEQMFRLYVPTTGEIEDFIDSDLKFYTGPVEDICGKDSEKMYHEVKHMVTQMVMHLFEDRFKRLNGLTV